MRTKDYRFHIHMVTTTLDDSKELFGGDRIQATLVFKKVKLL